MQGKDVKGVPGLGSGTRGDRNKAIGYKMQGKSKIRSRINATQYLAAGKAKH